jgi:hypothetical protein
MRFSLKYNRNHKRNEFNKKYLNSKIWWKNNRRGKCLELSDSKDKTQNIKKKKYTYGIYRQWYNRKNTWKKKQNKISMKQARKSYNLIYKLT